MTAEDRQESLADQAASWVPPWARSASQRPDRLDRPVEHDPAEEPAQDPAEAPAAEAAAGTEAPEPARVDEPTPPEPHEPGTPVEPPLVLTVAPEPAAAGSTDQPVPGDASDVPEPAVGSVGGAPEPAAGPTDESAPAEDPIPVDPAATGAGPGTSRPVMARQRSNAAQRDTPHTVDEDTLRGALEAILLVVDEPVTEVVLAQVLEQPTKRVAALLERIAQDYTDRGHGFELRRAAGGWRLYTRPEYAGYVERFVLDGQSVRLTQAALETLAVVAYKQPVTRSRISAIRGVNCDGVVRTLVTRGLIEECGTEPETGAFRYRTSALFLEKLGLDSLAELPPLAPFLPDDVEELTDAPR